MISIVTSEFLFRAVPLVIALAIAAAIDARSRRIPNWLTFSLLIAGLTRAAGTGGFPSLELALLGMLAGMAAPVALFALGAVGGGDVKLMAAIGAWLGWRAAILVFLTQAVIGLMIVLFQATLQGRVKALFRNSFVIAAGFAYASEIGLEHAMETGKRCRSIDRPLPFAVPVFMATVVVLALSRLAGS